MRDINKVLRFLQCDLKVLLFVIVLILSCSQQNIEESNKQVASKNEIEKNNVVSTDTVKVILTKFEIKMPNKITSGQKTFHVVNNGKVDHNFQIQGQGVDKKFDKTFMPGDNKSMTFTLKPGEYHVFCPVGNHKLLGMTTKLTVIE